MAGKRLAWMDRWAAFLRDEFGVPQPHPGQIALHRDTTRHRTLCKGRRGGGTTAAALEAMTELQLWAGRSETVTVGMVAPTSKKIEILFRRVYDILVTRGALGPGSIKVAHDSPQDRRIETTWGGLLLAGSLKEGLPFEGWGIQLLIVDEAQELPEKVWWESLAPTLMDTGGRALLVGKAKGAFFRKVNAFPEWGRHRFTSAANPAVGPDELEEWRASMPAWLYAQEVDAEFQDMGDLVFAGYGDCVDEDLALPGTPQEGRRYVDGWDLARKVDETVGITLDATERPYRVVEMWGGRREPWPATQARIEARQRRWDSEVWPDATGLGDAVLGNLGVPLSRICRPGAGKERGYIFTAKSKSALITNLQKLIEDRDIVLPNHPRLLGQLEEYRWDDGDLETDWVMALALAAMGACKSQRGGFLLV